MRELHDELHLLHPDRDFRWESDRCAVLVVNILSADLRRKASDLTASIPSRPAEVIERGNEAAGLVQRLAASGTKVARRTVAKYREGMAIPSSSERKRLAVR